VPSALPLADPAPDDGMLPPSVIDGAEHRDLGVYLHVPFCRVRCGYCDFNTYTADEIRGVKQSDFADQAIAEVALAGELRISALSSPDNNLGAVFAYLQSLPPIRNKVPEPLPPLAAAAAAQ